MHSNSNISIGQEQVWKIAYDILNEYKIDPIKENSREAPPYLELIKRLKENPIISLGDKYTSVKITKKELSYNYLRWISDKSKKATERSLINFDFNKMEFGGSIIGPLSQYPKMKVFEGGSKFYTTSRAILTLISGSKIRDISNWRIYYYINSGGMTISMGNHRTLAYKLLGLRDFPTEVTEFYEDPQFDEYHQKLNKSFLGLEELLVGIEPKIIFNRNTDTIIDMATEFGVFSNTTSNLFKFTKHHLFELKCSKIHNLKTLTNFINGYNAVMGYNRSFFQKFLKPSKEKIQEKLAKENYCQYKIEKRLEKWLLDPETIIKVSDRDIRNTCCY